MIMMTTIPIMIIMIIMVMIMIMIAIIVGAFSCSIASNMRMPGAFDSDRR